ncbi:DUF1850 domain-containing protein [Paenirhodobacter sp.]|uniref:DUF1850 domain-containing protein n=1 Tax=Paenirhodobacter sp. TaxID=1965326 RepID=UPI003B3F58CD
MICLATGAALLALTGPEFTLAWSHSVAHTRWEEVWQAGPEGLRPVRAFVQGPGAGMELPEGAERVAGGWTYRPTLPPQRDIYLAASGMTGGGWTLCAEGRCQEVGAEPGAPLHLWQAERCAP